MVEKAVKGRSANRGEPGCTAERETPDSDFSEMEIGDMGAEARGSGLLTYEACRERGEAVGDMGMVEGGSGLLTKDARRESGRMARGSRSRVIKRGEDSSSASL
jgi:hypothetical protein